MRARRRLGDEVAEAREVEGAGGADVEPGGDAGARGDRVGLDAPVGGAPVDVGVQVDEAGRDDAGRRRRSRGRRSRSGCRGRRRRSGRV